MGAKISMETTSPQDAGATGGNGGAFSSGGRNLPFASNHLIWGMNRLSRTFTVGVVEPSIYDPSAHAAMFSSIVSHLIKVEPPAVDGFDKADVDPPAQFDLVTFPEAFAPADAFLGVLRFVARVGISGCIHVGLRPVQSQNHLFTHAQLEELVAAVEALPTAVPDDFVEFKAWLGRQRTDHRFNLASLFAIDAENRLRVCLYPKVLRARVEHSALSDKHMQEADLLTLVTLEPSSKRFKSVTLQPLSCSDVFDHKTDRGTSGPIGAVNDHADCFTSPPDHIDIVSVATCTQQVEYETAKGLPYREWHQDFRASFVRAAEQPGRHAFSTFVLSNFRMLSGSEPGGLSGLFQPEPPRTDQLHDDVVISIYGRPDEKHNNQWSTPDDDKVSMWSGRGYLAGLDPFAEPRTSGARILTFELPYLLRDRPLWTSPASLVRVEVDVAEPGESDRLVFKRRVRRGG